MSNFKAVKEFINTHYKHFNAAALVDAAEGWVKQLEQGNKMFITLAGAMSTAELGISLAEMIRQDKVHGICCTGANLEEDIYNLIANNEYRRIPDWRALTAEQEQALYDEGYNRVTDTCIPEAAMLSIEGAARAAWIKAEADGKRYFPHEFMYQLITSGVLKDKYQVDEKHSWLIAACEKNLPIFVPGWEDSTLGNMFVAAKIRGQVKSLDTMKTGIHYMEALVGWYQEITANAGLGFFQIGGGIAGDFPICAVPLIRQDLKREAKLWSYFCQVSDSTTSYGGYSGAVPNEKITWGKLSPDAPKFIIESDASIVAPLVFSYVLAS